MTDLTIIIVGVLWTVAYCFIVYYLGWAVSKYIFKNSYFLAMRHGGIFGIVMSLIGIVALIVYACIIQKP